MKEIWKDIPGYKGYYQASNLGRVRRVKGGQGTNMPDALGVKREVFGNITSIGYRDINLCANGELTKHKWHRIILLTFKGHSDLQVNPKDGNKLNNTLSNLEYVTNEENKQHKVANKLHAYGERISKSKLKEKDVLEIRGLLKKGTYLQREIAEMYEVDGRTISNIKQGIYWKHVK